VVCAAPGTIARELHAQLPTGESGTLFTHFPERAAVLRGLLFALLRHLPGAHGPFLASFLSELHETTRKEIAGETQVAYLFDL
jgi:hypothetical protein